MVLSSERIVIYLAITLCITVCLIQQGVGQPPIPTASSCLKSITGLPGCFTALNLIVLYNNTRYLTLDCCRAVNNLSDVCSIVLFPTQPQAIYRLKAICSVVNPPSSPSSPPPPSGGSPPASGGAAPSPPSSGGSTPSPPPTAGGRPPSSAVPSPSASPRPSVTPFFQ